MSQPDDPVRYDLLADEEGPGYHIGVVKKGDFVPYDTFFALRRRCAAAERLIEQAVIQYGEQLGHDMTDGDKVKAVLARIVDCENAIWLEYHLHTRRERAG